MKGLYFQRLIISSHAPCNDTCLIVPQAASPCPSAMGFASGECRVGLAGGRACMAGGLAEWARMPPLLSY